MPVWAPLARPVRVMTDAALVADMSSVSMPSPPA